MTQNELERKGSKIKKQIFEKQSQYIVSRVLGQRLYLVSPFVGICCHGKRIRRFVFITIPVIAWFSFRLKLQQGETVLADSGYLYDTTLTGGRLGVYTHGQANVIWSRLTAKCLQRFVITCFLRN